MCIRLLREGELQSELVWRRVVELGTRRGAAHVRLHSLPGHMYVAARETSVGSTAILVSCRFTIVLLSPKAVFPIFVPGLVGYLVSREARSASATPSRPPVHR